MQTFKSLDLGPSALHLIALWSARLWSARLWSVQKMAFIKLCTIRNASRWTGNSLDKIVPIGKQDKHKSRISGAEGKRSVTMDLMEFHQVLSHCTPDFPRHETHSGA